MRRAKTINNRHRIKKNHSFLICLWFSLEKFQQAVVGVHTAIMLLIRSAEPLCWRVLEVVTVAFHQKKLAFMVKVVSVAAAAVAEQEVRLSHVILRWHLYPQRAEKKYMLWFSILIKGSLLSLNLIDITELNISSTNTSHHSSDDALTFRTLDLN